MTTTPLLLESARDPRIIDDAAAEIVSRLAEHTTGNCYIDAEVLIESGVRDLSVYGGGERPSRTCSSTDACISRDSTPAQPNS